MLIIGCDFHTRYQQIAMARAETGESLVERRLDHGGWGRLLTWVAHPLGFRSLKGAVFLLTSTASYLPWPARNSSWRGAIACWSWSGIPAHSSLTNR